MFCTSLLDATVRWAAFAATVKAPRWITEGLETVIENSNSQYLEMLKRSREQLKNGNVVVKSMDELERMEDEYDAKIADEAYDEYAKNGKKSRPINELWQAR